MIVSSALNFYDQIKTAIIHNNLNPVWANDEVYSFKSPKEVSSGWNVKFLVFDYDRMKKDDYLGEYELNINDDRFKPNGNEEIVNMTLEKVKHGVLTVGIKVKRVNDELTSPSPRSSHQKDLEHYKVDHFPHLCFKVPKRFKFDMMDKKKTSISCHYQYDNGDYDHITVSYLPNILQEMTFEKAKFYNILSLRKTHKEYSKLSGNQLIDVEDDVAQTLFTSQFAQVFRWQWIFVDYPEQRPTRVFFYMIKSQTASKSLHTIVYKTTRGCIKKEDSPFDHTQVDSKLLSSIELEITDLIKSCEKVDNN